MRPTDAPVLVADPQPAQDAIGWTAGVPFRAVITTMVAADVARLTTGVAEDMRYLKPPTSTAVGPDAL